MESKTAGELDVLTTLHPLSAGLVQIHGRAVSIWLAGPGT